MGSALPPGLALSPTGLLDGVPTECRFVRSCRYGFRFVDAGDTGQRELHPHGRSATASTNRHRKFPIGGCKFGIQLYFYCYWRRTPAHLERNGALPPGLSLSSGGVLSGKPTSAGPFPITVMVRDAAGQSATPQMFTVEVTSHGFTMTGTMNWRAFPTRPRS